MGIGTAMAAGADAGQSTATESAAKRVAYLCSEPLVRSSDALACHPGRSSRVHSLAYHLGLLQVKEGEAFVESTGSPSAVDSNGEANADEDDHEANAEAAVHDGWLGLQTLLDPHSDAEQPRVKQRRQARLLVPPLASPAQLKAFHEPAYVDALLQSRLDETTDAASGDNNGSFQAHQGPSAKKRRLEHSKIDSEHRSLDKNQEAQFGLEFDCPRFALLPEHVRAVGGAAVHAAEVLATGDADVAVCWDGGRHHAHKAQASGFCYVNDAVLAILALRKPRKVPLPQEPIGSSSHASSAGARAKRTTMLKRLDRVAYIDFDLHWGDGVEEAFYNSASVLTLSIHHHAPGFFPCGAKAEGAGAAAARPDGSLASPTGQASAPVHALNLPLRRGASSATLLRVLNECVLPVLRTFDPEAIVVQCGVDGAAGDPHAVWNLSSDGIHSFVQQILQEKKPTLLLGGGGYSNANAMRIWAGLTAIALGDSAEAIEAEPLPEFPFWSELSGSDSLHVPAGAMKDDNDEAHLAELAAKFADHTRKLQAWKTGSRKGHGARIQ